MSAGRPTAPTTSDPPARGTPVQTTAARRAPMRIIALHAHEADEIEEQLQFWDKSPSPRWSRWLTGSGSGSGADGSKPEARGLTVPILTVPDGNGAVCAGPN
jgi:hypothetical protein